MNTPTLETERLILRKFTEEDMEEHHDFVYKKYWNMYENHFVEEI